MPAAIPTPCRAFGCGNTTTDTYCRRHAHLKRVVRRQQRGDDRHRPNAYRRGYDRHWGKARRLFLMDHPLCVHCSERGLVVEATVVDHIQPHRGDPGKFWDRDNWQPLCIRCHNRKTATEGQGAWY